MYDLMNEEQFVSQFLEIRSDNFSAKGLRVLYNYLEDLADETTEHGLGIQFDPVAFCCQFSETTRENFEEEFVDEDIDDRKIGEFTDNGVKYYIINQE